jgi:hypothetical protein
LRCLFISNFFTLITMFFALLFAIYVFITYLTNL